MTMTTEELSSLWIENAPEPEPVKVLIAEHRVIERVLNCLERMAERWCAPGSREELDYQAARNAIVFFQIFVEAWHFLREEAYCVTAGVRLEDIGVDEGGSHSFHDHERCAVHLQGIKEAVETITSRSAGSRSSQSNGPRPLSDASGLRESTPEEVTAAYRSFGKHARAYSDILLKHIENEEDCMYPAIERRLSPQTKEAATRAFRRACRQSQASQRLNECLAIVGELAERFGVSWTGERP